VDVHRVLGPDGTADSWTVAEEIVRFGQSGLDILNLSFVCYTEDGQPPLVLSTALDRLPPDLVVVAAAGNHGDIPDPEAKDESTPTAKDQAKKAGWPAALDDVIAVGAVVDATAEKPKLAEFSPDAPWVDVLAPGVDLKSTFLPCASKDKDAKPDDFPNGWATWSGTSFAAALVSGAIAAATDPGRVSARSAALDIFAALERSPAPTIGETQAKVLNVPTF
jgi:subtilisin family serine protease